jgi:hypothetical protein
VHELSFVDNRNAPMIYIRKWIVPLERLMMWQGESTTALDNVVTEGYRLTNIVGLSCCTSSLFYVY